MTIHQLATPHDVASSFAAWLEQLVRTSDQFTIALSGGSTPAILFRLLAEEYTHKIDWEKIHFFWGDERCVPPDDEESNFKMTRDLLFQHVNVPPQNIHRIRGEAPPEEEAVRYAEEIASIVASRNNLPAFDLILLGMGGDGHTASIFPQQMELLTSKQWCAVATHPNNGQKRVSLTGPVINNGHRVAFLVTGESKAEKVQVIFSDDKDRLQYPASHISPKRGELHWFLDTAAGKLLS